MTNQINWPAHHLVINPLDLGYGAPAEVARGCEFRCRDSRLIHDVHHQGVVGAVVTISGRLTMSRAGGPVEYDLCAVRVSIEADDVFFGTFGEASS